MDKKHIMVLIPHYGGVSRNQHRSIAVHHHGIAILCIAIFIIAECIIAASRYIFAIVVHPARLKATVLSRRDIIVIAVTTRIFAPLSARAHYCAKARSCRKT